MTTFLKSNLFQRHPDLLACKEDLEKALEILKESFATKGKLLVMGNGGSSADAEHLCGELVKGFLLKRKLLDREIDLYNKIDPNIADNLQDGLPAFSLGVSHSLISAFSNDCNWDFAFAQQVHVLGNPNDVVLGITTSGNSKNVVWAMKVAKAKGIKTISLTGQSESQCSQLSDVTIRVPRMITHEAQELHLPVYHALSLELEDHFYAR